MATKPPSVWENRIVRSGMAPAGSFLANRVYTDHYGMETDTSARFCLRSQRRWSYTTLNEISWHKTGTYSKPASNECGLSDLFTMGAWKVLPNSGSHTYRQRVSRYLPTWSRSQSQRSRQNQQPLDEFGIPDSLEQFDSPISGRYWSRREEQRCKIDRRSGKGDQETLSTRSLAWVQGVCS